MKLSFMIYQKQLILWLMNQKYNKDEKSSRSYEKEITATSQSIYIKENK